MVNGKADLEMVLENRLGLMVPSTLENGEKTELMVKENSFTLMETFTMVSGLMIKLMDQAFISM